MIRKIVAKTILSPLEKRNGIPRYNMNIYRGCEHRCIYCDSRSECYQIEDFDNDLLVKVNAPELLKKELSGKRRGLVTTGSMGDSYTPSEKKLGFTRKALELIHEYGFGVELSTKSDLVLRDLDLLKAINKVHTMVIFTITTTDDNLAAKLEPHASPPSRRLMAMKALSDAGIKTGVYMMPILPFIEDNTENISSIVVEAAEAGATEIIPSFGMTLRKRQREFYYERLDELFPGLKERYVQLYGSRYECLSPRAGLLTGLFLAECRKQGLRVMKNMNDLEFPTSGTFREQLGLF